MKHLTKIYNILDWLETNTEFETDGRIEEDGMVYIDISLSRLKISIAITPDQKWAYYCNKNINFDVDSPTDLILALYNYYHNVYLIKLKKRQKYKFE